MILADKIIRLRKKNGWSQEELAEKLGVSRQSVSKWESAQSVPDLAKVLQMSNVFGVSTDYLLKDEIEEEEYSDFTEDNERRKLTMEEANEFLALREKAAGKIALGTFLCIISPILLLILGVMTETGPYIIPENLGAAVGVIALLLIVAAAVIIFIVTGSKSEKYKFLETEEFDTEYGVVGMVKDRQKNFRNTYTKANIIGVCLCIISPVLIFIGAFSGNDFLTVIMVCSMLLLVAIGVLFFVNVGVKWASYQKLLQEGEFSKEEKNVQKKMEPISTVYWLSVTAVFLGCSFIFDAWDKSWVIWPVAGVLYAILMTVWKAKNK